MFAALAAPQIWNTFSDDGVTVRYVFGQTIRECRGILRDVRVEFLPSDDGLLIKRTIGQLLVGPDETAVMGGIEDPQLKASFEIEDGCGEVTRWSVATSPDGNAIESKSSSFITINIQQTHAAARARPGYREA
jgi:hypothetical protein